MKIVERVHTSYVAGRRANAISKHLCELIPAGLSVLDVGCGDGLLDHLIKKLRPDLDLCGLDVLVRRQSFVPVIKFDGSTLPYEKASFDCVMFVDVLHHTVDPIVLLREALRVTRKFILIKDHLLEGLLAGQILSFMDRVGNQRHGVDIPYNYWTRDQWFSAWDALGISVAVFVTRLQLYPWPASLICDRNLHFVAQLQKRF